MPGLAAGLAAMCRGLVATCAITLSLAVAAAASAAPTPSSPRQYGINAQGVWRLAPEAQTRIFTQLKASGMTVVRVDVMWSSVQGPSGDDWTQLDQRVAALASAGLRSYLLLRGTPGWASSPTLGPPANDAFAAWTARVAARYGPAGAFWTAHPQLTPNPVREYEIWNEENSQRFWTDQASSPIRYGALYGATRNAVHAVDPGATVVVGGLVDLGAEQYLRMMFQAHPGLRRSIDAVAFHTYLPTAAWNLHRIREIRAALNRLTTRPVSLEITETGFSTVDTTDGSRGRELARLVRGLRDTSLGVTRLMPYAAVTDERDATRWEDWFGLFTHDGNARQSAVRFENAVSAALARDATQARAAKKQRAFRGSSKRRTRRD